MTTSGIIHILVYFGVVLALTKPLEDIEGDAGVLRIAQSMRDARR